MKALVILFLGLLLSCGRGGRVDSMDRAALDTGGIRVPDRGAVKPAADGTVKAVFEKGKSRTFIHKRAGQTVNLEFYSQEDMRLDARIRTKDSMANVRISQIIMPDGSGDGPFGTELKYDLAEEGTYKLVLHENMMAGDPWEGDFKVCMDLNE